MQAIHFEISRSHLIKLLLVDTRRPVVAKAFGDSNKWPYNVAGGYWVAVKGRHSCWVMQPTLEAGLPTAGPRGPHSTSHFNISLIYVQKLKMLE